MSDQSNVARPYAQAIFEMAVEQKDLAGWGDQLSLLDAVTSDQSLSELVSNPHVSANQLVDLITDVCGDKLSDQGKNLIKLLVRNDRITAVSEITQIYAERRAEAESVIEAEMVTATQISADQQKQFADALQKSLGRTVKLEFDVNEDLIGGAVIRAGDWVVDGSVKAQLDQLVGAIGA